MCSRCTTLPANSAAMRDEGYGARTPCGSSTFLSASGCPSQELVLVSQPRLTNGACSRGVRWNSQRLNGFHGASASLPRVRILSLCPALFRALLCPYMSSREPSMISQNALLQEFIRCERESIDCTYGKCTAHKKRLLSVPSPTYRSPASYLTPWRTVRTHSQSSGGTRP